MQVQRLVGAGLVVMVAVAGWSLIGEAQQLPLFPATKKGRTVTPAYEGW